MPENYTREELQDQVLQIQALVEQIEQSEGNRQVIQELNNRCNELNRHLDQSNAFRDDKDGVSTYNKLTELNSPLDDYTNLI